MTGRECSAECIPIGRLRIEQSRGLAEAFDHSKPRIIDPVVSHAGAIQASQTSIPAAAVDPSGDLIVTGDSTRTGRSIRGRRGSFVAKFDACGENILHSTYFPASGFDTATGLNRR